MKSDDTQFKVITHDFPVWRDRANFIIRLMLNDPDIVQLAEAEQIWARQIEESVFEVCCIPFFAYGIALGDLVQTTSDYLINEVREKKGHLTYRMLFLDVSKWDAVVENIRNLGCLVEKRWERSTLVSIDAPNPEIAAILESHLADLQNNEIVKVEIAI